MDEMTVAGFQDLVGNLHARLLETQQERDRLRTERDALTLQVAILTNERDEARAA